MFSDFLAGIRMVLRAFKLIKEPSIRKHIWVPLIINIVLFAVGITFLVQSLNGWIDVLVAWLPNWLAWLQWIISSVLFITIALLVYYSFTIVANFIASPFNSILSEKVEAYLINNPNPLSQKDGLLKATAKSVLTESRKLIYTLTLLAVLLVVTVIPVLNIISPLIWLLYGAWMLSLQYLDYPNGNHERGFGRLKSDLKQHRSAAIGMGGVLTILTFIPVLNFMVMPIGVIASTVFWHERLRG